MIESKTGRDDFHLDGNGTSPADLLSGREFLSGCLYRRCRHRRAIYGLLPRS